ncbi:MAG: hypothetical protein J0M26_23640, partial [Planctomycetes bacterium]|nr:hypothetical protein [Planctomycetota bacterium]
TRFIVHRQFQLRSARHDRTLDLNYALSSDGVSRGFISPTIPAFSFTANFNFSPRASIARWT